MARPPMGPLDAWLRRSAGRGPAAVVLGGSFNALSFARSLGRRGVPVLVAETERFLGTYTRYGAVVTLPPVAESAHQWVELLELVGSRLDRPGVLLSTSDEHNLLVAHHRRVLERHFRFVLPDAPTLAQIVDKPAQYRIAEAAGVPVPRTHVPRSIEEVTRLAAEIAYPCLLKPRRSHDARKHLEQKVVVVDSASALVSRYAQTDTAAVPLMIQEIVPGGDDALFGYLALWDEHGRELAWVTKRKLRQFPAQYGDGCLQETVDAPEVAELSRRLLRAFDYRGFVGVEFKRDARDGAYRLMEINARAVSGNQLAISAGVDFAWLAYRSLIGAEIAAGSERRFRVGVKYVNEEWDVQAFAARRRAGTMTLWSWLRSLRGVEAWALAAWDDPRPLAVGVVRWLRKLGASIRSRRARLRRSLRPV